MINHQSRKAGITFAILSFIAIIALLSLFYSMNRIIEPTLTLKNTLQCCPDLLNKCLILLAAINSILPWFGIFILLIGLINAIPRLILSIKGSLRLSERLEQNEIKGSALSRIKRLIPDKDVLERIVIFDDNRLHNAFTIGFLRPKIYLSGVLCKRLKKEELKAVILHEVHHVKSHDPLRLLLVAFICDIFFFVPLSRYLKELFISTKEKAADDAAISESKRPLELASAMMKILKLKNDLILNPTAIWKPDPQAERIHRLIDPMIERQFGLPYLRTAVSFIMIIVLVGLLTLPSFAYKLPMLGTLNCRSSHILTLDNK